MIRHIIQAALTTAAVAFMLVGGQQTAKADQVFDFVIANGTNVGGVPVGGTAHFVVSAGAVTVTLTNTYANPTGAGQLISGIQFHVTGQTASETLSASNYQGITIASDGSGTYTNTAVDPLTRWGLIAPSINLTTLTGGNPNMLIIGPPDASNLYSNANASIRGNGNPNSGDNPSLAQSVTFTITDPGILATGIVSSVVFEFGTGPSLANGTPVVPEPSSLALIGCGGIAYALRSVRRRKPSVSPSH